jgi:hypothetical protein
VVRTEVLGRLFRCKGRQRPFGISGSPYSHFLGGIDS